MVVEVGLSSAAAAWAAGNPVVRGAIKAEPVGLFLAFGAHAPT